MDKPTTDPFPLATDFQAVARTIANVAHVDGHFSMDNAYFTNPLPQILHSLVYSVMTGTFHDGFGVLVSLRKTDKKVLQYESNPDFRQIFAKPDTTKGIKEGLALKYRIDFNQYFIDYIVPYYRERLLTQCDVELKVNQHDGKIVLPSSKHTAAEARARVINYLVNYVIFPTLLANDLPNAADTLARLLVLDYGIPLEILAHKPDMPEQKGKKRQLAGLKFGRLHVLKEGASRSSGGHVAWDCVCDCGAPVLGVTSSDLLSWRRFSCGACYPKAINKDTLERAALQAKQSFYGATTSCVKRANEHADKVASREFDRNEVDADYETALYLKKKLALDKIMMLAGPSMVLHVAGLPILPEQKTGEKKDGLDLHRAGHERSVSRGPMMPYASSTICWVSSKLNRAHLADCTIEPYKDSPPKDLKASKPDETEASDLL